MEKRDGKHKQNENERQNRKMHTQVQRVIKRHYELAEEKSNMLTIKHYRYCMKEHHFSRCVGTLTHHVRIQRPPQSVLPTDKPKLSLRNGKESQCTIS